ncbi:MAG TPA: hypothetical protein VKN76_16790 [Kiloniellaceae bacterium]|nr:hypothetical protein [Kiloniellaceae bacterium]
MKSELTAYAKPHCDSLSKEFLPQLRHLSLVCLIGVSVLGCATRDEGAIDYRKGEIAAGVGGNLIGPEYARANVLTPAEGVMHRMPGLNLQNEEVRLVPLIRKYVPSKAPEATFTKLDSVSIRLQAAYIEEFTEGPVSYVGDLITEGQFHQRGEVAIVVNAFQLGDEGADFDFSTEGINKGRVVYFSQDVKERQELNFSNMPVYGPITYQEKPIGIDIAVMELDLSDQVTVDLLSRLASLGGKAFPPAAPVLDVLNSLGQTLVQNQTNDIDARYVMLFDAPEGGYADLPRAELEVGSYVFLRLQDRSQDADWEELLFDENTGRLYKKQYDEAVINDAKAKSSDLIGVDVLIDSDGTTHETPYVAEPYRTENYFSFQINKNEPAADIDLPNYDYGTFLAGLDEKVAARTQGLGEAFEPIEAMVARRVQIRLFDDLRAALGELKVRKSEYDETAQRVDLVENALALEPDNPDLPAEAAAAADAFQRSESALLRQFNVTWKGFEKALPDPPSDTPPGPLCTIDKAVDLAANNDDGATGEKAVYLSDDQCTYVLQQYDEMVQVTNGDLYRYFQPTYEGIEMSERKRVICELLFNESVSAAAVCG